MIHHILTISCGLLAAALAAQWIWCLSRPRRERFVFLSPPPAEVCDHTKTWAQQRCEFQRWTRTQRSWQSEMERLLKGDRR